MYCWASLANIIHTKVDIMLDYVSGRVPVEKLLEHDMSRGYALTDIEILKRFLSGETFGNTETNLRGRKHLVSSAVDVLKQGGVVYLTYNDASESRQITNIVHLIEDVFGAFGNNLTIATDLVSHARQASGLEQYLNREIDWGAFYKTLPQGESSKNYLGERELAGYAKRIIDFVRSRRVKKGKDRVGPTVTAIEPYSEDSPKDDRAKARVDMARYIGSSTIVVCHEDEVRYGDLQKDVSRRLPVSITVSQTLPLAMVKPREAYKLKEAADRKALASKIKSLEGKIRATDNTIYDVRAHANPNFAVDYLIKGRYDRIRQDDTVGKERKTREGVVVQLSPVIGVPHSVHESELSRARAEVPPGYFTPEQILEQIVQGEVQRPSGIRVYSTQQLERVKRSTVNAALRLIKEGERAVPEWFKDYMRIKVRAEMARGVTALPKDVYNEAGFLSRQAGTKSPLPEGAAWLKDVRAPGYDLRDGFVVQTQANVTLANQAYLRSQIERMIKGELDVPSNLRDHVGNAFVDAILREDSPLAPPARLRDFIYVQYVADVLSEKVEVDERLKANILDRFGRPATARVVEVPKQSELEELFGLLNETLGGRPKVVVAEGEDEPPTSMGEVLDVLILEALGEEGGRNFLRTNKDLYMRVIKTI